MKVTYLNPLSGTRCVLVDDVDAETAQRVRDRFSDKKDPYTYLPEVRVETDDGVPA